MNHAASTRMRSVATMLAPHLLVLLGYLLISMGLTWPIIAHWNTGLTGYVEEASRNAWNMWWLRQALTQGQNPFWCPVLFYPEGIQMYVQPLNTTTSLLTMPVQIAFGLIAAHNTASLLAFTLTGYGGFLLVRRFVPGIAIPFLCGAMLTAAPFHSELYALSHLNKLSIQWIPLYLWALFGLDPVFSNQGAPAAGASVRRLMLPTLLAMLFFVMLTLTDWYWALITGIFTATWVSIRLIGGPDRWVLLRRYAVVGSGILLALSPLLIGIAQVRQSIHTVNVEQNEAWRGYIQGNSADALGLFFPSISHPIWGTWTHEFVSQSSPGYHPVGWYMAAGWVLLICAGIGIWRSGRTHWRLLAAASVMWLLSLGPVLQVAGINTGIPMPYTLFEQIELISTARKPSHFAIICTILAAIFAGIGLHWLRQRLQPRWQPVLLSGVALLAVVELWPLPPQNVQGFGQPAFLQQIHDRPGVVADVPIEWQETGRVLRHQMVHAQTVVAGYVSRQPEYNSYYMPHIYQLSRMRYRPDIVPVSHTALTAMQCAYPIRHVIVNKREETPGSMGELQSLLTTLNSAPVAPAYEDAAYAWFELPMFPDQCQPFVYVGRGWYDVEGEDGAYWRWASAQSDIWLVNPFDTPIPAQIDIATDSFAYPRPVQLWREGTQIAQWHVGSVPQQTTFAVHLQPGINHLQLRAEPWLDPVSGRMVTVPVREITLWP